VNMRRTILVNCLFSMESVATSGDRSGGCATVALTDKLIHFSNVTVLLGI
jgi:hypothetical protein